MRKDRNQASDARSVAVGRTPGPLGMGDRGAARGRDAQAPANRSASDVEHRHHFRYWSPVEKSQGFDQGSMRRSQWQLVPLGSSREVELWFDRVREKVVFSADPDVVSVSEDGDRYVLRGQREGTSSIHAANRRGICWSALLVTVRQRLRAPIAFHFLQDRSRQTRRTPGEVAPMLARVNEILVPQTCVSFAQQPVGAPRFHVDADLGDALDPEAPEIATLCAARIAKLQTFGAVNVFFVWRVQSIGSDAVGAQTLDNGICFFGDGGGKNTGRRLAHELGHHLTKFDRTALYGDDEGHAKDPGALMDPLATGTAISRAEADVMYRTARETGANPVR